MTEYVNALNAALYTTLSGTALTALLAGGTASPSVYFEQAPDDATLPYVVWSYAGGPGHENRTPHETVDELVYVRGYAAAPAQAGTISSAIDGLLHGVTLNVSGWTNFWCARTQNISRMELDAAQVKTWSRGSFFRVRMQRN